MAGVLVIGIFFNELADDQRGLIARHIRVALPIVNDRVDEGRMIQLTGVAPVAIGIGDSAQIRAMRCQVRHVLSRSL